MTVQPYYQDDQVTLYHGDCREILPSLDPVDLVLTDPPYGISYVSNYTTGRGVRIGRAPVPVRGVA